MQLIRTDYFMLAGFCALPITLFLIYASVSMRKERRAAIAILAKLRSCPHDLIACNLFANDPITVEVAMKDDAMKDIPGFHGAAALKLFDELKSVAPQAKFTIFEN